MQLLTAGEVVEKYFGGNKKMSKDKLYRLAKKGEFPSIKLDGRVFFPDNEIDKWIGIKSSVNSTTTVLESYGRNQKKSSGLRVVNE